MSGFQKGCNDSDAMLWSPSIQESKWESISVASPEEKKIGGNRALADTMLKQRVHRRSLIVELDQRHRQQREECDRHATESMFDTVSAVLNRMDATILLPRSDAMREQGTPSGVNRLRLRPNRSIFSTPTSCAACARGSTSTPRRASNAATPSFSLPGCNYCQRRDVFWLANANTAPKSPIDLELPLDNESEVFFLQAPDESCMSIGSSSDEDDICSKSRPRIHLRPKMNSFLQNRGESEAEPSSAKSSIQSLDVDPQHPVPGRVLHVSSDASESSSSTASPTTESKDTYFPPTLSLMNPLGVESIASRMQQPSTQLLPPRGRHQQLPLFPTMTPELERPTKALLVRRGQPTSVDDANALQLPL